MKFISRRQKSAIRGCLWLAGSAFVALILYNYAGSPRFSAVLLYGIWVACVFGGLAEIAYALAMERASSWLLVVSCSCLLGTAIWYVLSQESNRCSRSLYGISISRPDLVCNIAFGIAAAAVAFVLACLAKGFMEKMRSQE